MNDRSMPMVNRTLLVIGETLNAQSGKIAVLEERMSPLARREVNAVFAKVRLCLHLNVPISEEIVQSRAKPVLAKAIETSARTSR